MSVLLSLAPIPEMLVALDDNRLFLMIKNDKITHRLGSCLQMTFVAFAMQFHGKTLEDCKWNIETGVRDLFRQGAFQGRYVWNGKLWDLILS